MYDIFMGETKNNIIQELKKLAEDFEKAKTFGEFKSEFDKWFQNTYKEQGILVTSKEEKDSVIDILSLIVIKAEEFDKLIDLFNLFSEERSLGKNSLLREIKINALEALWNKLPEKKALVLKEAKKLEERAKANDELNILFGLMKLYNKMECTEEERTVKVSMLQIMRIKGFYFFSPEYSFEKLEADIAEQEKKINLLKSNLNRDKIRLIEVLGLFAAIITFVVAGVVGLKGLNSAAIAITLTGLTACLTVLIMLIHIFTNKEDRNWKIAILIVALCVLVLWVLATVGYHIAKLVWG